MKMESEIQALYEEGIKSLKTKKDLFSKIEKKPELILTHMFEGRNYQPFYQFGHQVFGKSKQLIEEEISYHNMQSYLADILGEHFHTLDAEIKLELGRKYSYSSPFNLCHLGTAFLQFDIYYHTFYDHRPSITSEDVRNRIESLKLEQDKLFLELDRYRGFLASPRTLAKNPLEHALILWKKERVMKNLKRTEANIEEDISYNKKRLEKEKEKLESIKILSEPLASKYEKWRKVFLDLGYTEKTKEHFR